MTTNTLEPTSGDVGLRGFARDDAFRESFAWIEVTFDHPSCQHQICHHCFLPPIKVGKPAHRAPYQRVAWRSFGLSAHVQAELLQVGADGWGQCVALLGAVHPNLRLGELAAYRQ